MLLLIKQYLNQLFKENSFEIIEEKDHLIRYQNALKTIIVGFTFDRYANEFDVYLQYDGDYYTLQDLLFIDAKLEKEIAINFTSKQIAEQTILALKELFQKENCAILRGDPSVFKSIKRYSLERTLAYNFDLETRQVLNSAEIAWKNKDYDSLIQILKLFQQLLPPLWKKRYEYAEKKINERG